MSASRGAGKSRPFAAYLGPIGTYSEQATLEYFGIRQAVCRVHRSTTCSARSSPAPAEFGVVPVENSTEGAVSRNARYLVDPRPCRSPARSHCRFTINLLSLGGDLAAVKVVCAHPQALAQCQRWLGTHLPNAERRAVASNAEGRRLAAVDPHVGAIAGDRAASHYGLQTASARIQDDAHNRTRFYVIGGIAPGAQRRGSNLADFVGEETSRALCNRCWRPFAQFRRVDERAFEIRGRLAMAPGPIISMSISKDIRTTPPSRRRSPN